MATQHLLYEAFHMLNYQIPILRHLLMVLGFRSKFVYFMLVVFLTQFNYPYLCFSSSSFSSYPFCFQNQPKVLIPFPYLHLPNHHYHYCLLHQNQLVQLLVHQYSFDHQLHLNHLQILILLLSLYQ